MRAPTAVLLFGLPGSGKSTQAELLADTLAYEVLDAGAILGKALKDPARQQDPIVIAERAKYDSGQLVSMDFFVSEVVAKLQRLEEHRLSGVLSGWPRDMQEAEAVMPHIIAAFGSENVKAILIDMPKEVSMHRTAMRLTCTVCGRPQLPGPDDEQATQCRVCGGALFQRADTVAYEKRFEVFQKETAPVFTYLEKLGITLQKVDGTQDPASVYGEIVDAIERSWR